MPHVAAKSKAAAAGGDTAGEAADLEVGAGSAPAPTIADVMATLKAMQSTMTNMSNTVNEQGSKLQQLEIHIKKIDGQLKELKADDASSASGGGGLGPAASVGGRTNAAAAPAGARSHVALAMTEPPVCLQLGELEVGNADLAPKVREWTNSFREAKAYAEGGLKHGAWGAMLKAGLSKAPSQTASRSASTRRELRATRNYNRHRRRTSSTSTTCAGSSPTTCASSARRPTSATSRCSRT